MGHENESGGLKRKVEEGNGKKRILRLLNIRLRVLWPSLSWTRLSSENNFGFDCQ